MRGHLALGKREHMLRYRLGNPAYNASFQKHALRDSNPRHSVLETDVLPTELRTHVIRSGLHTGYSRYGNDYSERSKRCLRRVALPTRSRR